jgi:pectin methylesterase-like acyl-CoA thioesterase
VFTTVTITGNASIVCLQDDSNRSFIVLNRATGEYSFTRCNPSLTLTGTGKVRTAGCSVRLEHFASDRRVTAMIDTCQKKGSASVQTFSPAALFTITDRNTANNTCACPF